MGEIIEKRIFQAQTMSYTLGADRPIAFSIASSFRIFPRSCCLNLFRTTMPESHREIFGRARNGLGVGDLLGLSMSSRKKLAEIQLVYFSIVLDMEAETPGMSKADASHGVYAGSAATKGNGALAQIDGNDRDKARAIHERDGIYRHYCQS